MHMARLALLAQLGSTLPLVGLIWFVQIVAYPLFFEASSLSPRAFSSYHLAHSTRITFLVLPLMLTELVAAGAWLFWRPTGVSLAFCCVGLALVVVAWGTTGLLSVPRHEILARGFEAGAHRSLVATNWIRTACWSVRGGMLLWLLARALPD